MGVKPRGKEPSGAQQTLSSLTGRTGHRQAEPSNPTVPTELCWLVAEGARPGGHLQVNKLLKHSVLIGVSCCTCLFNQSILITVSMKAC